MYFGCVFFLRFAFQWEGFGWHETAKELKREPWYVAPYQNESKKGGGEEEGVPKGGLRGAFRNRMNLFLQKERKKGRPIFFNNMLPDSAACMVFCLFFVSFQINFFFPIKERWRKEGKKGV